MGPPRTPSRPADHPDPHDPGNPYSARLPAGDPGTPVVTYPQTVELARVLAMPRWRAPANPAADDLRQFQRDVITYTGIDYQSEDSPYDPLFRWYQKHHRADGTPHGLCHPR